MIFHALTDAPEIKVMSSCTSEAHMVKCVCIAESKPPSMVHFVLAGRVLQNTTKTEKHGTVTIGTLQAELGSSEFVLCLANNTQGNANLKLYLPVNSKEVFGFPECMTCLYNMHIWRLLVWIVYWEREKWHHVVSVWTGKMQSLYIIIAAGAGVILIIPLIAVGVVKKW